MKRSVYNLEFPSWCPEMTLFGYRFARVDNYQEQVCRLQHLGTSYSEFKISANTGTHSITAYVEIPEHEERAVLEWADNDASALGDILLLLSIFTQRDVFVVEPQATEDATGVITADPRFHYGGGILGCSIPYKEQPIESEPCGYDIGFEEGLNRTYALIRSEEWQRKYRHGYFLFLARMAFRRQPLEAAFVQCWTIWEHLFAILNQNWLSSKQIRQISTAEKISYILVEYALRDEISETDRRRIEALANIRNRLIHFGRFPDRGAVHDDAVLFTRLTEFVIAKILDLAPSNVLNTMEGLEEFLSRAR
ncbi:MAG: hypothetical protein WBW48_23560 [Anaerolineae bacterium]